MARSIQTPVGESLQAAAVSLGVSMPTLYRILKSGQLVSYRVGKSHRVSSEAIADYFALTKRDGLEAARKAKQSRRESPK